MSKGEEGYLNFGILSGATILLRGGYHPQAFFLRAAGALCAHVMD